MDSGRVARILFWLQQQKCAVDANFSPQQLYGSPQQLPRVPNVYFLPCGRVGTCRYKYSECCFPCRYGGYSFEVNPLVRDNSSTLKKSLEKLSTAFNNGKSVMNGSHDFWDDLDYFIFNFDYRNATKVSGVERILYF
jgi:hypothetical protein